MKIVSITCAAILGFTAISIFSTSCSNNKKDVLFGCDSVNVKFSTTIKPILANNCDRCHSTATGATFGNGIFLDSYTEITAFVDITSGSDGGILLNNIKHSAGANPMPKGSAKISDCEIAKISKWIKDGALNN